MFTHESDSIRGLLNCTILDNLGDLKSHTHLLVAGHSGVVFRIVVLQSRSSWLTLYVYCNSRIVSCHGCCTVMPVVRYVRPSQPGFVLAIGEGDTGQLGLGPDVLDRSKPAHVDLPAAVIQICAGGMHSACLTVGGEVSSSNCWNVYLIWSMFVFLAFN